MGPRFSIVVPAYNRGTLLLEALASVEAQTCTDFEVVVVDDGSTDGTASLLAPWLDRIRYLSQENQGESAAKNRGIAEARGDFIAFLDSDDRWEPEYLATAARELDANPGAILVAPSARVMTGDGRPTRTIWTKKSTGPLYTTISLLGKDAGTVFTPVVRRDALLAAGGFDAAIRSAEDCDLWLRLSFVGELRCFREPLLLVRVHEGNLSRDIRTNAEGWLLALSRLEREHPDFVRAHAREFRHARAKQLLRLGRELLGHAGNGRATARAARTALIASVRHRPRLKAWTYLGLGSVPGGPALFAWWRRAELRWRTRAT